MINTVCLLKETSQNTDAINPLLDLKYFNVVIFIDNHVVLPS